MTIGIKKTTLMGQGIEHPPEIKLNDYKLDVVHVFTLLGCQKTFL